MIASATRGLQDNPVIGIWTVDEYSERRTLLFRSNGRYQLDTRSTDPDLDFSSTERGRYDTDGQTLTLSPYDFIGEPESRTYGLQLQGDTLTLTTLEYPRAEVYQRQPDSAAAVLEQEHVEAILIRRWQRSIPFSGIEEYTFRPGGYFIRQNTSSDTTLPADIVRGRYVQADAQLTLEPYGESETQYELDFFGQTLTLIKADDVSCQSATYDTIPGSIEEVRSRSDDADAFLNQANWQVGIWEIRAAVQTVDLTLRPDGHYISNETTESLPGVVHGRYALEARRIHLTPFIGQDLYARSNGEFGKVERTRELDYYDGELQFIDLEAISQSVTLARKRTETAAMVMDKVQQAQAERTRENWQVGIWEVDDPAGWMDLTFRPDGRYIARSGSEGIPSDVERGRYRLTADKVTLAPYPGLGQPRGFELDLYDGDLLLVGDIQRLVIARKVADSEAGVIDRTRNPRALLGERGAILGRWTADLPGQSVELVYRPDGQFRLNRCVDAALSHDYGLYSVDMTSCSLVSDSRFFELQTLGLDFYDDTLTIFGGTLGPPSTYTVNLGTVDAAIEASLAADARAAETDAQWLTRVQLAPRDPNAVQVPAADVPADPRPDHLFDAPTVFAQGQLYRRLLPGFVYFSDQGSIRSVPVVNTREWYVFPTGRALVRLKNYRAGAFYPMTVADVVESWAAYRIDGQPAQQDILHVYADNVVALETDLGEHAELTLENGRRNLFWGKDYQVLSEWAAERQPEPCQLPATPNPTLMNTGVSLATSIEPDQVEDEPRSETIPLQHAPG
jgi:hypothetical protein